MSVRLDIDREALVAFCAKWHVTELSVFGSVLRDDFGPGSDVDLLITFSNSARPSLLDLVAMSTELEGLFGHPVDLMTRRGVEQSANPHRREEILTTAERLYAA